MRFGAKLDNYGPLVAHLGVVDPARRAEAAGFDSIWCSDHIVMPEAVRSPYPFSDDGSIRWDPHEPWYDAVVWCTAIAMATDRVEFGTAVMLAALRHPVVLAKQLASIDALSGGRLVAGFGAGWMREEFDALGVPFESRGRRLDEWIDVCRSVWSGRVSRIDGEHFSLDHDLVTEPRPERDIPILIGGMSDSALRRIAVSRRRLGAARARQPRPGRDHRTRRAAPPRAGRRARTRRARPPCRLQRRRRRPTPAPDSTPWREPASPT